MSGFGGVQAQTCPTITGSSSTMVFPSWVTESDTGLIDGDTIRAYDESGLCLGETTWIEMESVVLTIWGDDPVTPHKDGAVDGEEYEVFTVDQEGGQSQVLVIGFDDIIGSPSGTMFYSDAVYIVGEVVAGEGTSSEEGQPVWYQLGNAYPNPFSDSATLSLTLSESMRVTATVYDLLGRRVSVLHDGAINGGQTKNFSIGSAGLTSGSYIIRVASDHFVETRSFTVIH